MKKIILLVLTISTLFSCSDEFEQDKDDINAINFEIDSKKFEAFDGNWILTNISLNSEIKLIPPSIVNIDFSIDEESSTINYNLNGTSTCNQYGGKFLSLESNKLSFEQLYSTEILCESDLNNFETQYFELLFKTEQYSIQEGMLTLFSMDNATIIFERPSD
ncbi:META domain-containing protein [Aquimarina aggregata]|uniref:META domain-containing protein n=1 Tax=Aquimarina aggregata TaxID=1642818 RepID=UPI00248F695C|nr:META domain-containing protein [Aquimarina aggregata]